MKEIRKIGVVSFAIMTALILISSPGLGYTWTTDKNWNNQHGRSVPDGEIDGGHAIANDNGHITDIIAYGITGGTLGNPEQIVVDPNNVIVFHTRPQILLWWGDTIPARPVGCTKIYATAVIELYRETSPNNWVSKDVDSVYYERNSNGQTFEEPYLHVFEDRAYQNGDNYELWIYISGGWFAGGTQHVVATDTFSTFYRLIA
jgi:hypothetical protein